MREAREIREHAGHVITVAQRDGPEVGSRPEDRLLASWRRSLDRHLDPGLTGLPRILTAAEVRDHRERLEAFLRIARQGVEKLHEQVRDANYCVLLTDADGVTIDFRTVQSLDRELKAEGFRVGTCWSELHEGTCGVGTAIVDKAPMLVHRKEHFRAHNIAFTCSAAPIFGLHDELLAILDASALCSPEGRESQSLVFRMVTDKALLIENAFVFDSLRGHWILQLSRTLDFLDVQTEYLVAFDEGGRIVGGNRAARRDLLQREGVPVTQLDALIDCTVSEVVALAYSKPGLAIPLRMLASGERFFALLRTPPTQSERALTLKRPPAEAQMDAAALPGFGRLAIADPLMQDNVSRARKLANRPIPIMLLGETGTGKEAFAKAIHEYSERRDKRFVALNCAAIPENLIESELFGYRDGAFTGASHKGHRGKIVQSDGGTLFLDEIGDMPMPLQSRLLRVLAEGEVVPLGAATPVPVELSVICATHQDLPDLIAAGRFREDLYYRLNGAVFRLPALRERRDITEVILKVCAEETRACGRADLRLDADALTTLTTLPWPGNIRQLRFAMRYACAVCDDEVLRLEHFPQDASRQTKDRPLAFQSVADEPRRPAEAKSDTLREQMIAVLKRNHWQIKASAREMGLSRATFYRKMARFHIVSPNHSLEA